MESKSGNLEFVVDKLISQYTTYGDIILRNAKVSFPPNSDKIIVNGEEFFFNAKRVEFDGYDDKDSLYKISTYDFNFWVSRKKTYNELKAVIEDKHNAYLEQVKFENQKIKAEHLEPFQYDTIDNDIYSCFIAHKLNYIESDIGNSFDFTKVEEKLAEICREHGGKYYKNAAKAAKFAIIFSYENRTADSVIKLRDKGYKVTSFENMIDYFGLQEIFDTKGLIEKVKSHKSDIIT